jgi:cyclase
MVAPRVIPCLLVRHGGLYKTVNFDRPTYVGDPINAVRIFNDKEVDELIVLDIAATREARPVDLDLLRSFATEAFMPMCYGGGLRSFDDARRVFAAGIEKVAVNTAAVEEPRVVAAVADAYGVQSVVVSIDAKRWRRQERVYVRGGTVRTGLDPVEHAVAMQALGAGEIFLTSIDREGTGKGYDLDLIRRVSEAVDVPVIANGGAKSVDDLAAGLRVGAAASAAGSMFVFHGRHRAVLISYLTPSDRARLARR